ncbi:MAG: PKD domain-containing protein [Armatimonadetes bacterium]|nr:PKD domain-containing protein [Armatimonadota bacterium]
MKKVAVLLSIAAMGSAFAQTVIYSPSRSIADQSISLKSWGSGSISETDEVAYEGTKSIRVSSRNYFQGGRITMGKSSALSSLYEDKDNLLMLAFRIANSSVRITTTDGMKSEVYMAVPAGADSGWRQIGIPLQAITGFGKTNKDVKDVTFSGDSLATFYVGEIRVANDSTPITGSLDRSDMNLALGDEVEFNGSAFGGASQLVYNWDFDESDGLQVEATGATIKRRFRKPGKYVVTMNVVDVYGLKKPLVKKATITVNP